MREDSRQLATLKDELIARERELRTRIEQRLNEIMVEYNTDDEGAHALERASRDFAVLNLEREMHTLTEIESSLRRFADGEYGVCTACAVDIPVARLKALPWTRLCVDCAGGGVKRDLRPSQTVRVAAFR